MLNVRIISKREINTLKESEKMKKLLNYFVVLALVLIPLKSVNSYVPDVKDMQTDKALLCKMSQDCKKLAEVGYFEARGEGEKGIMYVMGVVLNRTNHPKFPDTITKVVNQPYQFSYRNTHAFRCGIREKSKYNEILSLSYDMINQNVKNPTKATHFHSKNMSTGWSRSMNLVGIVGNHKFFK